MKLPQFSGRLLAGLFVGGIVQFGTVSGSLASEPGCLKQTTDNAGIIHTTACSIPFSSLASKAAKDAFVEEAKASEATKSNDPFPASLSLNDYILKLRKMADEANKNIVEQMRKVYPVTISAEMMGGIQTDVVMPSGGIPEQNKDRVLINLHGGGMIFGARYEGQVMSVPIASIGKIKIVTVDYRMAPEYRFPAASEDVAAVYVELLKRYKPENIGIYGCSAGGALTAQALAWFQIHHLPRPGAAGILCAGSGLDGDSSYWPTTPAGFRDARFLKAVFLYGSESNRKDPLFNPLSSDAMMAKFPPTLFINSTRDPTLSSAIHAHIHLVKASVDAQLYVWDGLQHAFMYDMNLPESHEAYDIIVKFFDTHLGAPSQH